MTTNRQTSGFALIEMMIVVAVVGLLGFAAWRVMGAQQQPVASETNSTAQTAQAPAEQQPAIKTADDLTAVESTLDTTPIDDSSLNDLDAALDF